MSIIPFYLLLIFTPSISLAVLAFLIRQASISMAWPIDSTFISEVLPPRARSGVFGLRSSAWNGGFALASYLAGKNHRRSGLRFDLHQHGRLQCGVGGALLGVLFTASGNYFRTGSFCAFSRKAWNCAGNTFTNRPERARIRRESAGSRLLIWAG